MYARMTFTEPMLREQLRHKVEGDILGMELHPMPDRTGADGRRYIARDGLIHTYSVRMRGAEVDGALERAAVWRDFLANLRAVADDEEICFWVAIQPQRRIHGISTFRRLVGIWPEGFYKF